TARRTATAPTWMRLDASSPPVSTVWCGSISSKRPGCGGLAERAPAGGEKPLSVPFSPGRRPIAGGVFGIPAVALLDGATLQPLKSPDTTGVTNGDLNSVAFSSDGRFLYAAGSWRLDDQFLIRRWSAAGEGAFVDLLGPNNTVRDLRPLPGG